ncbi:hypothetical protein chiPu_0032111 [Chiloscyllium punctatum]|uniref:Uncharacterized protein n=1 Tax=Chiloscyllium punctatum TaxID=137246 RepID=A0A401TYI5_CHIPU|nr:hypothetical protein [Chiloscyllium punctatum]
MVLVRGSSSLVYVSLLSTIIIPSRPRELTDPVSELQAVGWGGWWEGGALAIDSETTVKGLPFRAERMPSRVSVVPPGDRTRHPRLWARIPGPVVCSRPSALDRGLPVAKERVGPGPVGVPCVRKCVA